MVPQDEIRVVRVAVAKVQNNKLFQDSGRRRKGTRGRWLGSGTIGETMCMCLHEQAGKARAVHD